MKFNRKCMKERAARGKDLQYLDRNASNFRDLHQIRNLPSSNKNTLSENRIRFLCKLNLRKLGSRTKTALWMMFFSFKPNRKREFLELMTKKKIAREGGFHFVKPQTGTCTATINWKKKKENFLKAFLSHLQKGGTETNKMKTQGETDNANERWKGRGYQVCLNRGRWWEDFTSPFFNHTCLLRETGGPLLPQNRFLHQRFYCCWTALPFLYYYRSGIFYS